MRPAVAGYERQNTPSAGKCGPKINKACVPCRTRRVKCDAAIVGLPCSTCRARQCTEECLPLERKPRTRANRERTHVLRTPILSANTSNSPRSRDESKTSPTSDRLDCQSPGQTEPDLLYLQILKDAVDETVGSDRLHNASNLCSKLEESRISRNCVSTKLSQADPTDREYLAKKGVFDLPPSHLLDALVKTHFDHVHPFLPVINRADFIRSYELGNCSLLLLRVILTTASLHAPANVLSDCGFADRSAAQESFFSKAKLLHDFAAEDDLLSLLQASIILCMVILDHPTDRDFSYWFHNAICLATKLDLRKMCVRENKNRKVLKLYRRIWWALYSMDTFHVSVDTKRSLLLKDIPAITQSMEDIWEDEDVSGPSCRLLSVITPQQRASLVVQCELSQIFRQCLTIVTDSPQQEPWQMMHRLDDWRDSLASKMHVDRNTGTDTFYLSVQALSYRFECVLCRQIRRQSGNADWAGFAMQRLRTAVLELDTITMRVLAKGTLQEFPVFFITTMTALLALHIESAVDPSETDLIRSMARVSINQAMLILTQGKEIPAFKRALPIFNQILTRTSLSLVPSNSLGQVSAQPPSQDNSMADACNSSHLPDSRVSPSLEQWQNEQFLDMDFLGFESLDQWQQF